jgi:oxygen-dependent protoporphyrinogen oxidase
VEVLEEGFRILLAKGSQEVSIRCRQLISAVPAHAIPRALPFLEEKHLLEIDNLEYAPVTEVAIGFNQWHGRPLDGFGGLIPSKEQRDILGILFMSTLFDDRAPKHGALLNVFLGGMRNQDIKYMTDQNIRQTVAREVSDLMELDYFDPDLFEIKRYGAAIPQYTITTDARLAAIDEVEKKYPGLTIAGNARDGIGIPNRVKQAVGVAEKVLEC